MAADAMRNSLFTNVPSKNFMGASGDSSLREAGPLPTAPPLRLRMRSHDILCARSMEVEWDDGTGVRQYWSSWTNQVENGWYEAEKLLPSSSVDISVRFKVRGLGGPWDVNKVHRRRDCAWATTCGQRQPEIVWFRTTCHRDVSLGVDAIFQLRGPMNACYLWRAWNSARSHAEPEDWEYWDELDDRPCKHIPPATLLAADGAAPLAVSFGQPQMYYTCTTKRLGAAARALLEVHRSTAQALRSLDTSFFQQRVGVTAANTATAGLGIASALLLFTAPPVGLGLGIASAATGSLASVGDAVADQVHSIDLREQLSRDTWNAFAFSELLAEWVRARQSLGASDTSVDFLIREGRSLGAIDDALGDAIDAGLAAGAVAGATARVVTSVGDVARTGAGVVVASGALGVVGALISTGYAIRSWSGGKPGQHAVRQKMDELNVRILQIQHLLAATDRVECPICCDAISLADDVRRCTSGLHCFHANCLDGHIELDPHVVRSARNAGIPLAELIGCDYERAAREACSICGGNLEQDAYTMVDSISAARS
eukprot:CAMPEP_0117540516 /NCGR_PEP_ID=MMETSP0784-20121206/43541_1 /TAXON_ID=39447 /ORGANISM="" /LENGTH=542 /DNA_ID=CAMNT_0005337177 /DNA_START=62 /DNA_END=1686 /DNA_ORIENTATION=-